MADDIERLWRSNSAQTRILEHKPGQEDRINGIRVQDVSVELVERLVEELGGPRVCGDARVLVRLAFARWRRDGDRRWLLAIARVDELLQAFAEASEEVPTTWVEHGVVHTREISKARPRRAASAREYLRWRQEHPLRVTRELPPGMLSDDEQKKTRRNLTTCEKRLAGAHSSARVIRWRTRVERYRARLLRDAQARECYYRGQISKRSLRAYRRARADVEKYL